MDIRFNAQPFGRTQFEESSSSVTPVGMTGTSESCVPVDPQEKPRETQTNTEIGETTHEPGVFDSLDSNQIDWAVGDVRGGEIGRAHV